MAGAVAELQAEVQLERSNVRRDSNAVPIGTTCSFLLTVLLAALRCVQVHVVKERKSLPISPNWVSTSGCSHAPRSSLYRSISKHLRGNWRLFRKASQIRVVTPAMRSFILSLINLLFS